MSVKYLIGNWVAFVQQIQHLISRGYTEYCLVNYPEDKAKKYLNIDRKLIEKYNANLNKDKTYYNKTKGYCNFKFLRWGNLGIILRTKGDLQKNIVQDDAFSNVEKQKINVRVGERVNLLIGFNHENIVTVAMDNETYQIVKATCFEYVDSKDYYAAISTFNNLNGLPSWGGIVQQKIKLKGRIVKKMEMNIAKKKCEYLGQKMKINTKRTPVKVF